MKAPQHRKANIFKNGSFSGDIQKELAFCETI
jgi:hypothetical protein